MNPSLRIRLAAALLLSPLAALVAQPASAGHPAVVVEPAVVDNGYGYGNERWNRGWRRDERAPQIFELTPQPGDAQGRRFTLVSARFMDQRSGIDPASVRLRIDGRDVSQHARVSADEIRYRDRLAPGRHVAEVIVRDRAGNVARRTWQFDVLNRGHERYGYGYGVNRY